MLQQQTQTFHRTTQNTATTATTTASIQPAHRSWNNGKEVPRLDLLTSLTTPGQQKHYGQPHPDSKYNKSMLLAAVSQCHASIIGRLSPLPCLITWQLHVCYISQLLRDSFSVSQQPPIWEPPSHYSMTQVLYLSQEQTLLLLLECFRITLIFTMHCM